MTESLKDEQLAAELEAARQAMELAWEETGHDYYSNQYQTAQARYDAAVKAHNNYYQGF